MVANVVSIASRQPPAGDDTTVVEKEDIHVGAAHTSRVQLRLPMRDLDEIELHLTLLQAAITNSMAEIKRARRNHRTNEARLMVRHYFQDANRLISSRARLTKP